MTLLQLFVVLLLLLDEIWIKNNPNFSLLVHPNWSSDFWGCFDFFLLLAFAFWWPRGIVSGMVKYCCIFIDGIFYRTQIIMEWILCIISLDSDRVYSRNEHLEHPKLKRKIFDHSVTLLTDGHRGTVRCIWNMIQLPRHFYQSISVIGLFI